jgi:uncharacterized membrane protein/uncharacterized membrane protein YgcG
MAGSPSGGGGEWIPENLRDPGFDRYVDLALLSKAWDEKNASTLTDVALQFREGERILFRPHRGFSSQQLLQEAARIAAETKQTEALQRLRKIAETTGSAELKTKLASAEKLAGEVRATDPALQVSIAEMTPAVFAELWEYFHAIQDASLAADATALKEIQDDLADNTGIPAQQKKYLEKLLQASRAAAAALPETEKQLGQALDKLSDSSRKGGGGGGSHSSGGSHAGGGGGGAHASSAHTSSGHTPGGHTPGGNALANKPLGSKTVGGKTLGGNTLAGKTLGGNTLGGKALGGKTLAGHDPGHTGFHPGPRPVGDPGLHHPIGTPVRPAGGGTVGVASTGTVVVNPPVAVYTATVPGTPTTNIIPPAVVVTNNGGDGGGGTIGGGTTGGGTIGGGTQGGGGGCGCVPPPTCPPGHHPHHHHGWCHRGWYFVDGAWVYYNCTCVGGDVAVADTAVYGGLWFENLQDEEVTVAIVSYDANTPTWMVTGWYVVEPGERVCVVDADVSNQTFYYYAFSANWQWEGDDNNYYVNPNDAFSYDSQDPAAVNAAVQAGYEKHGFNEIDVGDTSYFLQRLQ